MQKNKPIPHFLPESEILTFEGWKRWDDLNTEEVLIVPNLKMQKLSYEKSNIIKESVKNKKSFYYNPNNVPNYIEGYKFTTTNTKELKKITKKNIENYSGMSLIRAHGFSANGYFTEDLDKWRLVGLLLSLSQKNENIPSSILFAEEQAEYVYDILERTNTMYWGATEKYTKSPKTKKIFNNIKLNINPPHFIYEFLEKNRLKRFPKYRNDVDFNRGILESFIETRRRSPFSQNNRIFIEINPERKDLFNLVETVSLLSGFSSRRKRKTISYRKFYYGVIVYLKHSHRYQAGKKIASRLYSGDVFTAQTPNGYFIARRNPISPPLVVSA